MMNINPMILSDVASLGRYLKSARKRRGLSLVAVAQLVGCGKSTIDNIEKGSSKVALEIVLAVLDVYGLYQPIDEMAKPENDKIGIALMDERLSGVKGKAPELDSDF